MLYTNIIEDFTWSYSRIKAFETCPYSFLLKYIYKVPSKKQFFSDYGSFIHKILEKFFKGELKKEDLLSFYLINFKKEIKTKAPSQSMMLNYFNQGVDYLKNFIAPIDEYVIGVEKEVKFQIDGRSFIGFIDLVTNKGEELIITDNKSRNLKKRSNRKKPLKSDIELDNYLRQLYLYSIPINQEYGKLPKVLRFNCFRSQNTIEEPFDNKSFEESKKWATDSIEKILREDDWKPDLDFFKCKYICDVCDECEYFKMFGGD